MKDNNKNRSGPKESNIGVKGIHCSSCGQIIEKTLKKYEGVKSVSVNPLSEEVKIKYEKDFDFKKAQKELKKLGYTIDFEKIKGEQKDETKDKDLNLEKKEELKKQKKKLMIFIPLAILVLLNVFAEIIGGYMSSSWHSIIPKNIFVPIVFAIATVTFFWLGKNFSQAAIRFFKTGTANMDTLIGIGTGTAYFYSSIIFLFPAVKESLNLSDMYFFDVTIIVIVLVYLGKYLESIAKLKTSTVLQKLMNMQAKTAIVERDNQEHKVSISDLELNDVMIVKTGEKIPTDGKIVEGNASIDESLITGESMPVEKNVNDKVIGSTINNQGYIKVKVTKIGKDTFLSNIISAVQEAQNSKAPIQKMADYVSGIFVPIVLVLSVVVLVSWLVIAPRFMPISQAISLAITAFVSVLVIACPCALGLATPTGIMVGLGLASKNGILIKNAEILEKLGKTQTIVFDKTGTITEGKIKVNQIETSIAENDFISITASLEKKSNHPLAKAVTDLAEERKISVQEVSNFSETAGLGITGIVNDKKYWLGNEKLMFNLGLKDIPVGANELIKQGKTSIFLSNGQEIIGYLALSDVIKKQTKEIILKLKSLNIKTIMLSGDKQETANYIAKQAGIDEVLAEVSPLEKASKIKSIKKRGDIVAMVGDGINDAVALAASDIGFAMSDGSDIAIESADVTILKGDLSKIIQSIKISKITINKIKQNLFWAFFYNVIAIPIAAGALFPFYGIMLSPIIAAAAMSMSSISIIINTLTMKRAKI